MPGLTLLRGSSTALVQRGLFRPSFCMVAQGEKVVQAGDLTLRYGAADFMVSSIDMPVVGLGGLGHLAVKFAVALGAVVTVLSRSTTPSNASSGPMSPTGSS